MKFNSRPVIPVYHFWIRVTQVPFTSTLAVTFFCGEPHCPRLCDSARCGAARSGVASHRVATRRIVPYSCTAARHANRWYSRCDARPLYFRPALESASNSIIRVPKRPHERSQNSREYEYVRATRLRKFRAEYQARTIFFIFSVGFTITFARFTFYIRRKFGNLFSESRHE